MPDRGTTSRLFKSASRWLWDWLIEHWPQIIMVGGAGIMICLASITAWLHKYGPLAYGAVGLGTYLLIMLGYMLYGIAKKSVAASRLVDERWKTGTINPLEGNFSRQRIKLSDFFSPFYVPIRAARFQGCELLGPSNVFLAGCNMVHCIFDGCQTVIVAKDKKIIGVTAFINCIFERCGFFNVTIYMTKEQYISSRQQIGAGIDMISERDISDL
jgi:hypothetical protein